jgi:CRP/FNR family cyclic AMP-dependent transcriptional regulator
MTSAFWDDIFKFSKKKSDIQILEQIPVFNGLSKFDLNKVSKLLHLRSYKKDEFIFREKEPGESMYIIKSGKVIINKIIKEKETILSTLDEGSFFGEVSLVDEDVRSANAIATEDSELLGFFRADLMNLIDRNPRLACFILYKLSTVIGKRLRLQSEK